MKLFFALLIASQLAKSIFTNPIPEPTLEYIVPLIAIAGAAAFGAYGGALGPGFAGGYPYNAGGAYCGGSPYYGGGGGQYYGGNPYYGGNSYYGSYY